MGLINFPSVKTHDLITSGENFLTKRVNVNV